MVYRTAVSTADGWCSFHCAELVKSQWGWYKAVNNPFQFYAIIYINQLIETMKNIKLMYGLERFHLWKAITPIFLIQLLIIDQSQFILHSGFCIWYVLLKTGFSLFAVKYNQTYMYIASAVEITSKLFSRQISSDSMAGNNEKHLQWIWLITRRCTIWKNIDQACGGIF